MHHITEATIYIRYDSALFAKYYIITIKFGKNIMLLILVIKLLIIITLRTYLCEFCANGKYIYIIVGLFYVLNKLQPVNGIILLYWHACGIN